MQILIGYFFTAQVFWAIFDKTSHFSHPLFDSKTNLIYKNKSQSSCQYACPLFGINWLDELLK